MRISIYHNLKSERDFSSSTALTQTEFEELAHDFCQLYQVAQHQFPDNFGNQIAFTDGKELLFMLLYYKKTYPSFDVLGLCFGLHRSTVHNYVFTAKQILKTVLDRKGVLPKRIFTDQTDFDSFFTGITDLIIDATERPVQRPADPSLQEESYSVKKNSVP